MYLTIPIYLLLFCLEEEDEEEEVEEEPEESQAHGGGKAKSFVWNFFTKVQSGEDPKSFTTKCSRCQVTYKWRTGILQFHLFNFHY